MTARITTSRTMTVQSGQLTAGDLRAFTEDLPADARVRVDSYRGDQRDPSTITLTVSER